ncbi:MAG: PaaI family thioesterase [Nevskiaceae bacterium]|nr:MAG: PaaI family thioesterase [Nevskiaceae bacterium]TBR72507.1 MAG: PaaI family thioesterase [Nevskiaceae bacterium]
MDSSNNTLQPRLDAAAVETIIRRGLPIAERTDFSIVRIGPGVAEMRFGYAAWMVRPGGSVSGPVLMMATDTAMYAVLLAHTQGEEMALTSDLTFHFLGRARPGDLRVMARLLKLGRRVAVMEVEIRDVADTLVMHASGTYMRPPAAGLKQLS